MMKWIPASLVVLFALLHLSGPPALAGSSNSLLAIHADGRLVACSNRDSGTVTVLSLPDLKKHAEIPVGHHPEGLAWIPGTQELACCVYDDDQIVVIDAGKGVVTRRIDVFDEPYGIVCTSDGKSAFVTLEYPGQVLQFDLPSWKLQQTWPAGSMVRGIALSPDESSVYVTEYLTARLTKLSAANGSVLQVWEPASTDNLCRQVTLSPDGRKAYFTHIRSRVSASHGNGSIFPYVSVATLAGPKADQRVRVPMDSLRGARVTANPWETDVSPDGRFLYVIFGATNDMYVCRVVGDDYQELDFEASYQLGNNPRAVRVTPDGQRVLVYNALDFELVSMHPRNGTVLASAKVTENPMSDELLLGKKMFYTALQPMSSRSWISCSSCHPDGQADGRTWQQPEGLRNTQALAGLAWTHPIHWSADRDEVQDFEYTIRGLLMQGQGLSKGDLPEALADKISGSSEALDALAAYTNSHTFTLSPHAKDGLSQAARRGQQLFLSDRTRCATCHTGPFYTDSQPCVATDIVRHDVGTCRDDPSELMEPAYDTPTLLGVYRTAPYLHHGKAETLRDVLTTWNHDDQHGITSTLSETELDDLEAFLKALPFEDPVPAARAAGLICTEK